MTCTRCAWVGCMQQDQHCRHEQQLAGSAHTACKQQITGRLLLRMPTPGSHSGPQCRDPATQFRNHPPSPPSTPHPPPGGIHNRVKVDVKNFAMPQVQELFVLLGAHLQAAQQARQRWVRIGERGARARRRRRSAQPACRQARAAAGREHSGEGLPWLQTGCMHACILRACPMWPQERGAHPRLPRQLHRQAGLPLGGEDGRHVCQRRCRWDSAAQAGTGGRNVGRWAKQASAAIGWRHSSWSARYHKLGQHSTHTWALLLLLAEGRSQARGRQRRRGCCWRWHASRRCTTSVAAGHQPWDGCCCCRCSSCCCCRWLVAARGATEARDGAAGDASNGIV